MTDTPTRPAPDVDGVVESGFGDEALYEAVEELRNGASLKGEGPEGDLLSDVADMLLSVMQERDTEHRARIEAEAGHETARKNFHTMQLAANTLRTRAEAAEAKVAELTRALDRLTNAKALASVRNLVAGWNGEGRPGGPHAERHPARLGATLPKTDCGSVYELDEALTAARSILTPDTAGKDTA